MKVQPHGVPGQAAQGHRGNRPRQHLRHHQRPRAGCRHVPLRAGGRRAACWDEGNDFNRIK